MKTLNTSLIVLNSFISGIAVVCDLFHMNSMILKIYFGSISKQLFYVGGSLKTICCRQ